MNSWSSRHLFLGVMSSGLLLTGCHKSDSRTAGSSERQVGSIPDGRDLEGNHESSVSGQGNTSLFRTEHDHKKMVQTLCGRGLRAKGADTLRQRSRILIDRVQRISSGPQPCWVSTHLLLTIGQAAGSSTELSGYSGQVIGRVLQPKDDGAFLIRDNRPHARVSGTSDFRQSHQDQFLYKISTAGLSDRTPLYVEGSEFTLQDLLLTSMADADVSGDVEWTVAAYAWFLTPNASWTNKYGSRVRFVDLLDAAIHKESEWCGGAHRLISLARSLIWSLQTTDPETKKLNDRIRSVLRKESSQLVKGQRSTGAFLGAAPKDKKDNSSELDSSHDSIGSSMLFTAHSLEWMAICPPDVDIREHSLEAAATFILETAESLCDHVEQSSSFDKYRSGQLGALAHVCSALRLALPDVE